MIGIIFSNGDFRFKIDILVGSTTTVTEPMDFSIFAVSWAKEITWPNVDPSGLIHELVASGGFDRGDASLAVYYGEGTTGLAHDARLLCDVPAPAVQAVAAGSKSNRPARVAVPGFIRYLWHNPPLVLYGEPMPLACPSCSAFRQWDQASLADWKTARSVCRCCGWHIERKRPDGAREVAGNRTTGRWLTVVLR